MQADRNDPSIIEINLHGLSMQKCHSQEILKILKVNSFVYKIDLCKNYVIIFSRMYVGTRRSEQ